jgi:hypothetical protein
MLDIRTPIGLMFILIGILVGAYGLMADKAIYAVSLGHNINLMWGLVMLVVGGLLFVSEKLKADTPGGDIETPGVKWPPKDEQS